MPGLLLPNEILSMNAQAVRRLIEAGDGDCALLYLALLEGKSDQAARQALHWGDDRVKAAWSRLARMGLVEAMAEPAPTPAAPAEELPAYSRKDVAQALEQEPEFSGLYREVERQLGRFLSDADLQILLTIYDGMALPPEVVLLLVGYVIRAVRRQKQNPGAMPRMTQIRAEASRWKRLGLDSVEAAEGYLRRQEQVDRREWEILSAVGVTDRRPAVDQERNYIASWVELGMSDELIALAYQRTVFRKGRMNWPYMNKILLEWNKAGWRTVAEVEAGDKPAKRTAPAAGRKTEDVQPTQERIRKSGDWLDRFLEQQGKGEN